MAKRLGLLLVALLAIVPYAAGAGERLAYERAAFDAALAKGGPVLLHVTAPWCSDCKAQKPVVEKLRNDPAFAALTVFELDYDTQKDGLKAFGVQRQATLVVFKGGKEVHRAVGVTRAPAIESLVRKAL